MKVIPIRKKLYFNKEEIPLWSRCPNCGEVNIISESQTHYCENCKSVLSNYLRKLNQNEIIENIEFI